MNYYQMLLVWWFVNFIKSFDRIFFFIKAPSIFEHEDIKKGILLQLFGGTKKNFIDIGRKTFRSQINILLCGDHGTAKSQLQEYVCRLVPRAQYINGKGTHADRLTVYVTEDRETGQGVLQT